MSISSNPINTPAPSVDMSSLDVRELQALIYREIGLSAIAAELFGADNCEVAQPDIRILLDNLRHIQRAA